MLRFLLILSFMTSMASAQSIELETKVLTPAEITKIIGPFPKPGSIEEKLDFKLLLAFQNTRTEEDCKLAARDESMTLKTLFGGTDGILSDAEVKSLSKFLTKV